MKWNVEPAKKLATYRPFSLRIEFVILSRQKLIQKN